MNDRAAVTNADAAVHQALADPSRRRLLDVLVRADGPRTATALAKELRLHVTTVRAHLRLLDAAGLIRPTVRRSTGPGRPAQHYEATVVGVRRGSDGPYRLLAEMLVHDLADEPDAERRAHQVGRRWGTRIMRDRGAAETHRHAAVALAGMFADLGFAPERGTELDLHLRACPFRDLAEDYQHVVCRLHLGMAQGALAELDSDVTADELEPFVEPDLCVLRIATAR